MRPPGARAVAVGFAALAVGTVANAAAIAIDGPSAFRCVMVAVQVLIAVALECIWRRARAEAAEEEVR